MAIALGLQVSAQNDTVYVYIEVPADSAFCIQYLQEAYDDGWNDGYELAISQCNENTCPADLNQDGTITTSDLLAFLSVFSLSCDELD